LCLPQTAQLFQNPLHRLTRQQAHFLRKLDFHFALLSLRRSFTREAQLRFSQIRSLLLQ
jgi:hypothetical protein